MSEPELKWPSDDKLMLWEVEPEWPETTYVVIGGGPSLTPGQVDQCQRDHVRVIAVNDAYKLAPWADVLHGADARWWKRNKGILEFGGIRSALCWDAVEGIFYPGWDVGLYRGMRALASTGVTGLEMWHHRAVRNGGNSGYQAINLAAHLGASRIILLGFDLKPATDGRHHWFGDHADWSPPNYIAMHMGFFFLPQAAKDAGVEIVNCTPGSDLANIFPEMPLEMALGEARHRI
ncbi:unnamed protein product [marine sediment metagenome]|uniref:Uncharacterized protein n=1 Tax=marine sediment metagenome TaxID=412755 RepID=X0YY18_9ZZZZ